jgi:hypothetical protein
VTVLDRLEAFAAKPAALATIGLWAVAEAVVLPIVPDVGLCLLVLAAPRQGARLFAAVIAGGLVGTLLLAALASAAPDLVRNALLSLPGIDAAMLADASAMLVRRGVSGFAQFGPGAPLKVYTDAWVSQGGDLPGLLVGTILNRFTRIGPSLLVVVAIGWGLRAWIRRFERLALVVYAAFWVVLYAAYRA